MISSLPSSQRLVPVRLAVPSEITILLVGDMLGAWSFFVAERPVIASNFSGVYFPPGMWWVHLLPTGPLLARSFESWFKSIVLSSGGQLRQSFNLCLILRDQCGFQRQICSSSMDSFGFDTFPSWCAEFFLWCFFSVVPISSFRPPLMSRNASDTFCACLKDPAKSFLLVVVAELNIWVESDLKIVRADDAKYVLNGYFLIIFQ